MSRRRHYFLPPGKELLPDYIRFRRMTPLAWSVCDDFGELLDGLWPHYRGAATGQWLYFGEIPFEPLSASADRCPYSRLVPRRLPG